MPATNNDAFYTRLPVNEISLSELLDEEHLFYPVPENWQVIITDVKNSTAAIQNGLHETVNLVATGSIVAVLNIAYKAGITVPFFFGGDGATFIVPPGLLETAMHALALHRQNTQAYYDLSLRVGSVPVTDIYRQGFTLRVSKFKSSTVFSIPVLIGNGLAYAEKIIKGEEYIYSQSGGSSDGLDLTGMECRWDRIKPPENNYEVVSLLVMSRNSVEQAPAFKKVIDCLDKIYGAPQSRRPISVAQA